MIWIYFLIIGVQAFADVPWSYHLPVREEPVPEPGFEKKYLTLVDYWLDLDRGGVGGWCDEASKETLIRRVSITLTGLPPTSSARERFLADTTPGAYERILDYYLSSARYGERMAWHWMQVARYADTDGYQLDGERSQWPWRDWVIDAFNKNMPFDRFSVMQIAGDLLRPAGEAGILASAFNRNHCLNDEAGALPEEFLVENRIDRAQTVASVWLGMTLSCARCHDHPHDPLTQEDFYRFYAFFDIAGESGLGPALAAAPVKRLQSPLRLAPPYLIETRERLLERRRDFQRSLTSRTQQWVAEVRRANDTHAHERDYPDFINHLINRENLTASHWGMLEKFFSGNDQEIREINNRLAHIEKSMVEEGYTPVPVMVMGGNGLGEYQTDPLYVLADGSYSSEDRSRPVRAGIPAVFQSLSGAVGGTMLNAGDRWTRLDLAEWIVSPENPLTARVVVNRIWQQHFGEGLVRTPGDFGFGGERPIHQTLLDGLAVELIRSGWDLKHIHRMILKSRTWRQKSSVPESEWLEDPDNRHLRRGPSYRMDGAAIRDQALLVSGLLDGRMGGPPVFPVRANDFWSAYQREPDHEYIASTNGNQFRRVIYTHWKRAVSPPEVTFFDGESRETCRLSIDRVNTIQQSLLMMNEPVLHEASMAWARRLLDQFSDCPPIHMEAAADTNPHTHTFGVSQIIMRAFDELSVKEHFSAADIRDLENACRKIYTHYRGRNSSVGESIEKSTAALCHLILNLDPCITVR